MLLYPLQSAPTAQKGVKGPLFRHFLSVYRDLNLVTFFQVKYFWQKVLNFTNLYPICFYLLIWIADLLCQSLFSFMGPYSFLLNPFCKHTISCSQPLTNLSLHNYCWASSDPAKLRLQNIGLHLCDFVEPKGAFGLKSRSNLDLGSSNLPISFGFRHFTVKLSRVQLVLEVLLVFWGNIVMFGVCFLLQMSK